MTKEPLPATHNTERGARSTCREEPETGPSLEASEHQHDCLGIRLRLSCMSSLRWYTWKKIVWRTNMEKIARTNIMVIYEDWRIFRRILKRDLALDRTSGRCR